VQPNRTAVAEIESLYRQYGAALVVFASAITGERSRAQDAVHQVFVKLIEDDKLAQAKDKKAYLFACVRNAALNEGKILSRNVPMEGDSAWFSSPGRDLAQEIHLRRALGELPDDQREAIVLHIWGEFTFEQIGQLLNLNSNTVASRYRYGLARLRQAMGATENTCANSRRHSALWQRRRCQNKA
jgi:RNA polymerase sigma-70 factor, ECF subfamily